MINYAFYRIPLHTRCYNGLNFTDHFELFFFFKYHCKKIVKKKECANCVCRSIIKYISTSVLFSNKNLTIFFFLNSQMYSKIQYLNVVKKKNREISKNWILNAP